MKATVTIVDNVTRAIPALKEKVMELKRDPERVNRILESYDNREVLRKAMRYMAERLNQLSLDL